MYNIQTSDVESVVLHLGSAISQIECLSIALANHHGDVPSAELASNALFGINLLLQYALDVIKFEGEVAK